MLPSITYAMNHYRFCSLIIMVKTITFILSITAVIIAQPQMAVPVISQSSLDDFSY